MTIRAVFFDMGGTIETFRYTDELRLEAVSGIRRCLLGAGIDLHLSNEQILKIITAGLKEYKSWSIESMEELPPQRVWGKYVFAGLDMDPQRLGKIAEELAFIVETRFYLRAMRPEVPVVLEALRSMGLKIGLISNVNSRGQVPANLEKYGICQYFDPVVLSSEYGRRKPDPSIFHYAARLANVPTSTCLYVGDRVARDIIGARKAGYRLAVQIRHDFDHGEDDSGATPDRIIDDLQELPAIIQAENERTLPVFAPGAIRAVLFDAGDILYHRPDKGAGFKAFLAELGLQEKDPAREKEQLTQDAYRGRIDQDQYREALLRLYGIQDPACIERGKRVLEADDNSVEFMQNVPETLLALKQRGYLLGIVTDTANPVHTKLRWFESGGIGHIWDSFISSMEVGTRKPDPPIYQAALEQLGLPAGQAVFVGHKASELNGARQVGMHTIAFNYDPDAAADYFIEKFPELLKLPILT